MAALLLARLERRKNEAQAKFAKGWL